MICQDGDIIFESREAIETRIKEIWISHGFDLSFESFSVGQRLVDVFVETLYKNQEVVQSVLNKFNIYSVGSDLDVFANQFGITRQRLPLLNFEWRNEFSNLQHQKFLYVKLSGVLTNEKVRYKIQNRNKPHEYYRVTVLFSQLSGKVKMFDNSIVIEEDSKNFEILSPESNVRVLDEQVLYPHKVQYVKETSLRKQGDIIVYTNSSRAFKEIIEDDTTLRNRLLSGGITKGVLINELQKVCNRADVRLVKYQSGETSFKLCLMFDKTEENELAIVKILDAYLPMCKVYNEETGLTLPVYTEGDYVLSVKGGTEYKYDIYVISALKVSGIDRALEGEDIGTYVSYALLYNLLGSKFKQSYSSSMEVFYHKPSEPSVWTILGKDEVLAVSQTSEAGFTFKVTDG